MNRDIELERRNKTLVLRYDAESHRWTTGHLSFDSTTEVREFADRNGYTTHGNS